MGSGSARAQARRLLAIAAVVIMAGAIPAGAATGWSVPATPNPTGAQQAYLDGVSCKGTTTLDCFAVGSYISAQGAVRTLIERWNGASWKIIASPNRTGAVSNSLVSVSCFSTAMCFAVGNSQATTTSAAATLIERWNGTAWTIAASPNEPHSTGNYLQGVSCVGPFRCYAAGDYTAASSSGSTLIERWDGKSWALMASPNEHGAAISTLAGVSCTAALVKINCFAVGSWSSKSIGSAFFTLTERFNGASWVIVPSPNVAGKFKSQLEAVSCTNASQCVAVGVWQHSPGASLSEHWNGTAWSLVTVVNPPGFTFSQLNSVSCVTPTNCLASGSWSSGSTPAKTLIAHWNGAGWAIIASPNPAGSHGSSLASISCVAAKCAAVGSYLKPPVGIAATLAERNS